MMFVSRGKKKTHEQFLNEIKSISDEIIFLEKYKGANVPIKVIHKKCNNQIKIRPSIVLRNGIQCKFCFLEKNRLSIDEIKKRVLEITNGEYEVISNTYKNNRTKMDFIHRKCGFKYKCTFDNFYSNGTRCPICETKSPLTKSIIEHRIKIANIKDYMLIDIINNKQIVVKHKKCNKISYVDYQNFMQKRGICSYCARKIQTQNELIIEVFKTVGYEYTVLGNFKKMKDKVLMRHEICGSKIEISPHDFLHRHVRCSVCYYNGQSKKEEEINRYLKSLNINYKRQYIFEDCKNEKPLPFDFAIFDKDNTLMLLIEYQGEQHYKPIDLFGGKEKFIRQKENDNIKRNYCQNNNIKLLEIPYWDFKNYRNIISNSLREVGVYG